MYAYFYLLNKTIKAQECDPASLTGEPQRGFQKNTAARYPKKNTTYCYSPRHFQTRNDVSNLMFRNETNVLIENRDCIAE